MSNNLRQLVRRRLRELNRTPQEAAQRSGWVVPAWALEYMASSRDNSSITERLIQPLARALDVPAERIRQAAGLPDIPDTPAPGPAVPQLPVARDAGE